MKNKIQILLQMDTFDYEMMLFGMWARWCESVTISDHEFQKVLASSLVNNWFNLELSKLEAQFLNEVTGSKPASLEQLQECYNDTTYPILSKRPIPLLKAAKAKEVENTGYMSLHGIKIETKTFNQN